MAATSPRGMALLATTTVTVWTGGAVVVVDVPGVVVGVLPAYSMAR